MAVKKLSAIATGGAVAGATDTLVAVRSGTTDVLVTPVTLDLAQVFSKAQGITVTDSATTTVTTLLTLDHETSGTPGVGFGGQILWNLQDTTTASVNAAAFNVVWSTATHASRSSQIQLQTVSNAGALSTGLIVGSGISGSAAGLIVGGRGNSTDGAIWASAVSPSTANYAFVANSNTTAINVQTGGTILFLVNAASDLMSITATNINTIIPQTTTIAAIGTAATAGATWINTTAAAAGAQQYSPALQLSGQGWKTTATAGSQQCDWQIQCQPVQGTTAPTSTLTFATQFNSTGGFTNQAALTSGGILQVNNINQLTGSTLQIQTGAVFISLNSSTNILFSAPIAMQGIITKFNNISTAGMGVPAIYGLDNRTGLTSADGSAITLYTSTGANQVYRISADIFATAVVTGTANYTIAWTENGTSQTAVVTATAINVLGTSTQVIRPDNATNITAQLTGTFTGTFSVVGAVERIA